MIRRALSFLTQPELIGAVLILGLFAIVAVGLHRGARDAARQAEAGQTLAEGRTAAAQDASAIRDRADARNDQITEDVKKGTDDVRKAADRDSANRAARRGVCRVDPRAHPDCGVLLADPGRVD